jgi:glycosyltransferase involved in cell wall biosynthesis
VADQAPPHEHLIQDAGTGPELEEWVTRHSTARLAVEKDAGVYDGLNRGFARATGDIFSFLHCDEQYLPGALAKVNDAFSHSREPDLVVGDYLIVDPAGQLLSFHRATPLRASMILTDHLYDYTCALFFRRQLWESTGGFGNNFRILGDAEWVARLLALRPRIHYLREFTSAFTVTGENLSLRPEARAEEQRLRSTAPSWARLTSRVLRRFRHAEKLLRGGYHSAPLDYSLYLDDSPHRTPLHSPRPSPFHPWRPPS